MVKMYVYHAQTICIKFFFYQNDICMYMYCKNLDKQIPYTNNAHQFQSKPLTGIHFLQK